MALPSIGAEKYFQRKGESPASILIGNLPLLDTHRQVLLYIIGRIYIS